MPDSFCWNQVRRFLLCFMFVLMSCSWRDFSSERWNEKTKSKWGMEVEQVYSRRKNEISCVWVIWFCSHPSNLFRWLADSSSTIIESRNFSDAAIEITTSEKNDSKTVYNYIFLFKASIVHRHKNSSICIADWFHQDIGIYFAGQYDMYRVGQWIGAVERPCAVAWFVGWNFFWKKRPTLETMPKKSLLV